MNLLLRLAFFMSVLISTLGYGQGQVKGKVLDGDTPLPGASVSVKGQSIGTATSFDGDFTISNLDDGSYTIVISYIGYTSAEKSFNIENSSDVNLGDIILSEGELLDEVVVKSAYRPSQARALNIKKASLAIAEVLAADAIGKLPDRNAAEAVQRLQGVSIERDMGEGRFVSVRGTPIQWSSSTLNGNRMPSASGDYENRGVQMDIFPSELIQYVKLSKAITPDMDGDAIGGSVDFITKSAPHSETLTANIAGGYVDQSEDPTYNASIVYGNKITDKLSFISSAVIWDRSTGLDQFRGLYDYNNPDPIQSFSINELQLRDYLAKRRTLGFNLGLDYQINKNNKVYFKGLYSQYLDQQSVRETYFTFNQNSVTTQARHADYLTDLYSLQLGGKSILNDAFTIDWSVSTDKSSFKFNSPDNLDDADRGYPIVNFKQPMQYGNLSSDGLKYFATDAPDGIGDTGDVILPHVTTALDPSMMNLNQIILSQNNNEERDYRGQFDITNTISSSLTLKGGFKYVNKYKKVDRKVLVWMPTAALGIPNSPITTINDLETEEFPYNGGFLTEVDEPYNDVIINQITDNQIDQMFTPEFQQNASLLQVQGPDASSNLTSSYSGTENVYASYLMGTYKLNNKWQFVAGFRNEYNAISFSGKEVVNTENGQEVQDITQNNNYNAFLPMAHFKFSPSENTILRGAYTRSFARPDFGDLNPGTFINEISQQITQGNTDLKPTFSNNFDLMFEHYFGDVGILTGGVFYKDLSNVIYDDQNVVVLNGENYLSSRPENLESATLFGFETGISKRFTKLPGFLSHFGIEGNYTYIDSKVDVPFFQGEEVTMIETTLPKQAKHIFNAILFYESNKFMARIAGNYKGKYLNEIRSSAGPEHYAYFDENFTVDFSSSYAISDKFRLYLELNNITNAPNRYYHGVSSRVEQESYFSFRGQIGLTYSIF
ncbi:TonB-dependent receptor [Joostella sp. CR20]